MEPEIKIPLLQTTTTCKICDSNASLYGVVDFTKNGREPHVKVQLSGFPIYYSQCSECGFLFTRAFDDWDIAAFNKNIYNESYHLFDPDYEKKRPAHTANQLLLAFGQHKEIIVGLDYGGGNGHMSHLMQEQGFDFTSWDPIDASQTAPTGKKFNLITAVEVLEHMPNPKEFFKAVDQYLEPDGICIVSTEPIDIADTSDLMQWWYVAPLNGHISIFSYNAVGYLCQLHGLNVRHYGGIHIMYREKSVLAKTCLAYFGFPE